MADTLEPQLFAYTGNPAWSGSEQVCHPITGLRQLAIDTWPDVKRPVRVVVMPAEDYEIMVGDLAGVVYTPHRPATLVTLREPVKPSRVDRGLEWLTALYRLSLYFFAWYGCIRFLDLLLGRP